MLKLYKIFFKLLGRGESQLSKDTQDLSPTATKNIEATNVSAEINRKRRKNENPRWGRRATTINNYRLKNDGTEIDLFVAKFRNEIGYNSNRPVKVSGLSGKPRRLQRQDDWISVEKKRNHPNFGELILSKKLYRLGAEFEPEEVSVDLKKFRYDPDKDYVETISKPLKQDLEHHFSQYGRIFGRLNRITGRIRSNGNISVWFDVWCEISAVEAIHHLRRFKTRLMKSNPTECIPILNNIFSHENVSIQTCYDNYETQAKIFKQVEEKLFEKLEIDPIKWKNQEMLIVHAKRYFQIIKTEHSPSWLGQQRFDIYIPEKKVAIEYQGQQHYEPITFFGGEEGFQKTIQRDKRKLKLSKENGIRLLYWKYTTEINEASFKKFIKKNGLHQ